MTLYVPAHTSAVGSFALLPTVTAQVRDPVLKTVSGQAVHARSTKSPTVKGLESPLAPGFMRPTAYCRNVLRADDVSGGFDWWIASDSGYQRRDVGSDARMNTYAIRAEHPGLSFSGSGLCQVSLNLQNRTVAEALVEVNNQKINLGTLLAEARTTANMIATAAIALYKAVTALRAGNPGLAYWYLFGRRRGAQPVQQAQEMWLGWQYGWRPLISDIVGGIEQIREGFRGKGLLFSVRRTITQPLNPRSFFDGTYPLLTEGRATESCRVELWGLVESDILSSASTLGLINPLSVLWEVVPYSFVLDWLLPVGTFLESLTATVGVRFVAGYRQNRIHADITAEKLSLGGYTNVAGRKPKIRNRVSGSQRVVYSQWPWALPYFKSPFSTTHVASAAALLSQHRRG